MATRKRAKQVLGYEAYMAREDGEYRHFKVNVFQGVVRDAAQDYDEEPRDHNLDRLKKVRELGESSEYLCCGDQDFSLTWQTDRGCWESEDSTKWYACSVSDLRLDTEPVQLLAKLVKGGLHWGTTPAEVLAWLERNKARRVSHKDAPYYVWIFQPDHYDVSELKKNPFEVARQD